MRLSPMLFARCCPRPMCAEKPCVVPVRRVRFFYPGSFYPEPCNPEPCNPEPCNPEPCNPEPCNPEPCNPEPCNPEPCNPGRARPPQGGSLHFSPATQTNCRDPLVGVWRLEVSGRQQIEYHDDNCYTQHNGSEDMSVTQQRFFGTSPFFTDMNEVEIAKQAIKY